MYPGVSLAAAPTQLYADESIHRRYGFIVTAIVAVDPDANDLVFTALTRAGLQPGIHEYKSSATMKDQPHLQQLRADIFDITLRHARLALLFSAPHRRTMLGTEIVDTVRHLAARNALPATQLSLVVDEGIAAPSTGYIQQRLPAANVRFGGRSNAVAGLQIADLVASYAALLLIDWTFGSRRRTVLDGSNGWEPREEVDLSWVLWAQLRDKFFMREGDYDDTDWCDLLGYGVFVGQELCRTLEREIIVHYGRTYLGCIH
jgi:hypothetical protein